MENMWICPGCGKEVETKIVQKEETLSVKGKLFTLLVPVRVCVDCGEEIIDEKLDGETLCLFYDEYKKSEQLLTAQEIKEIRAKYNLSQSSFSKLLGFGEKTITRYENGSIQDVCHDNLIRLMKDIHSFRAIWNVRKGVLTADENSKIEQLIQDQALSKRIKVLTPYQEYPKYETSGMFSNYKNREGERYVG